MLRIARVGEPCPICQVSRARDLVLLKQGRVTASVWLFLLRLLAEVRLLQSVSGTSDWDAAPALCACSTSYDVSAGACELRLIHCHASCWLPQQLLNRAVAASFDNRVSGIIDVVPIMGLKEVSFPCWRPPTHFWFLCFVGTQTVFDHYRTLQHVVSLYRASCDRKNCSADTEAISLCGNVANRISDFQRVPFTQPISTASSGASPALRS